MIIHHDEAVRTNRRRRFVEGWSYFLAIDDRSPGQLVDENQASGMQKHDTVMADPWWVARKSFASPEQPPRRRVQQSHHRAPMKQERLAAWCRDYSHHVLIAARNKLPKQGAKRQAPTLFLSYQVEADEILRLRMIDEHIGNDPEREQTGLLEWYESIPVALGVADLEVVCGRQHNVASPEVHPSLGSGGSPVLSATESVPDNEVRILVGEQ